MDEKRDVPGGFERKPPKLLPFVAETLPMRLLSEVFPKPEREAERND